MKKVLIVAVVLLLLASPVFADKHTEARSAGKMEMYEQMAENNIQIMVIALAGYANAHDGKYPTPRQFYSRNFDKYLLVVVGEKEKNTDKYYKCCPVSFLRYCSINGGKSYKIWCPYVKKYGLKSLYFTPEEGMVKEYAK